MFGAGEESTTLQHSSGTDKLPPHINVICSKTISTQPVHPGPGSPRPKSPKKNFLLPDMAAVKSKNKR